MVEKHQVAIMKVKIKKLQLQWKNSEYHQGNYLKYFLRSSPEERGGKVPFM